MKRALITGGAGFIGSHLADGLLNDGYDVVVMDNESTGFKRNVPARAEYILGDVTKRRDVERAFYGPIDLVLHLAAQASTIRSFQDPLSDLITNVTGTVNVLEMCLIKKIPRLLYASSMTCYGHPERIPIAEEDLCRPISYYGITKYAAERYVHAMAARNDLDFEFNVTSFRMFNVFGERQSLENPYQGVMAIFISNISANKPIRIHSDGDQSRDFVYIGDVVSGWLSAIKNTQAFGELFNLGTGKSLSINKLVDLLLEATGKSRSTYPIHYGPERPGDQKHMLADTSKAKKILGWNSRTNVKNGMDKTIQWANENWRNRTGD